MSDLTWIVILIPAFPLLGFLLNTFFIRQERSAGLIASGAVVLSFITVLISIYALQTLPEGTARIDFVAIRIFFPHFVPISARLKTLRRSYVAKRALSTAKQKPLRHNL